MDADVSLPNLKHFKLLYCEIATLNSYHVHSTADQTKVVLKTNEKSANSLVVKFFLPSTTTVTLNGSEIRLVKKSLLIRGKHVEVANRKRNSICPHCEETSYSYRDPVK